MKRKEPKRRTYDSTSVVLPIGDRKQCNNVWWPTPAWVTRLLLEQHPPPATVPVVEPSAGEGDIVAVLLEQGFDVWAIEKRTQCMKCRPLRRCAGVLNADWLQVDPRTDLRDDVRRFSIIGNPPYTPAHTMLAHVAHCLEVRPIYCALLPGALRKSRPLLLARSLPPGDWDSETSVGCDRGARC